MQALAVITVFVVVTLALSHKTYHFKADCSGDPVSCNRMVAAPGVDGELWYAAFSVDRGHLKAGIMCSVINGSDSLRTIDISQFSLVASDSVTMLPHVKRKTEIQSNELISEPGSDGDLILVFKSTEQFKKKRAADILKHHTFYLIRTAPTGTDTIFALKADDHRLK